MFQMNSVHCTIEEAEETEAKNKRKEQLERTKTGVKLLDTPFSVDFR